MKSKMKRLSKSTISVVLALIMVVSMIAVGVITASAWNGVQKGKNIYFVNTGSWSNVYYHYWGKNGGGSGYDAMTQVPNTGIYCIYYSYNLEVSGFNFDDNQSDPAGSSDHWEYVTSNKAFDTGDDGFTDMAKLNGTAKVKVMVDSGTGTYSNTATAGCVATVSSINLPSGWLSTQTTSGSTSAADNEASCYPAYGATVTYTASSSATYDFMGFSITSSPTAVPNNPWNSGHTEVSVGYNDGGNLPDVYAYFKIKDTLHTVTPAVSPAGAGTVTPSTAQQVGQYTPATFEAAANTGYTFSNWSLPAGVTLADGYSTADEEITVNATAAGTVTAHFTEKAQKKITITAPENGSINVKGSSVTGDDDVTVSSSDSDTVMYAHVDDKLTITATPDSGDTDTGYKLTSMTLDGQVISSGYEYTVANAVDSTINASFEAVTSYRIKVFAGTGGITTMTIQGEAAQTLATNQATNFDVPWGKEYTVGWADSTSATFSSVTRNGEAISGAISGGSYTGDNEDDGTVYKTAFTTTQAWPPAAVGTPGTAANGYVWVANNNGLSSSGGNNKCYGYQYNNGSNEYKVYSAGDNKYWVDLSKDNLKWIKEMTSGNFFVAFATSSGTSNIATDCTVELGTPHTGLSSSGIETYNFTTNNKYAYVLPDYETLSDINHIGILIDTSGTNPKYTIYASGTTGGADTEYDPFYLSGRFVANSKHTGDYEGDFDIDADEFQFTDEGNYKYTLETDKTIAELSAELRKESDPESIYHPQYFLIHDKGTYYAVTLPDYSGGAFQNINSEAKALTLTPISKATVDIPYELVFNDKDTTSDGKVVFHIDAKDYAEGNSASSIKIWYTLKDETAAVADKLTFNVAPASVMVGTPATLTATATGVSNPNDVKFVFEEKDGDNWVLVDTVNGSDATRVSDGVYRAQHEVTNDTAASYTYRVTVKPFNDAATSPRSVSKQAVGTWTPLTVYYTSDITSSATSPTWTLVDKQFASIPTSVSAGNSYTISLSDKEGYNLDFVEFDVAEDLNQYCDIVVSSKTVTVDDDDRAVRTYVVTPRTGCSNPTIYIDTAHKRIYAVATYGGDTTTKTLDSTETVTYYFAERVDDKDLSNATSANQSAAGAGKGMRIRYWNASVQTGSSSTDCMGETDVYVQATNGGASNTIYVNNSELYTKDTKVSGAQQYYVYKVDLPVGATSFKYLDASGSVLETEFLWSQDWGKGAASDVLNPNRIYLLFNGNSSGGSGCYYRSQGVILDKHLWEQTSTNTTNQVSIKNFDANLINYTDLITGAKSSLASQTVNSALSTKYNTVGTPHTLYFGDFNTSEDYSGLTRFYNYKNLAQRANSKSYFSSIQDLVGPRLSKTKLNENGYGYLLDTQSNNDKGISKASAMPLFDYSKTNDSYDIVTANIASAVYEGLKFPMNVSEYNGITTYSYDSTTDYNRIYSGGDFKVQEDSDTVACEAGNTGYKNYAYGKDADSKGYAGFFPFGGNSDQYSNTGFGTEFDISFYMTTSGALQGTDGTSHDIMFSFSGDDDVWVYVDGVKVLDLGGDHKVSAGAINFTDGKVYYKSATNTVGSVSATNEAWASNSNNVKTVDLIKLLAANGVNFSSKDATTKHTLQMFYMERGAYQSNCSISFNLPQASGLNVRNTVLADYVNKGLKEAALASSNRDYFTYTVGNATASNADYTAVKAKGGIYANARDPQEGNSWQAITTNPLYPYNFDVTREFGGESLVLGSSATSTESQTGGHVPALSDAFSLLSDTVYTLSDKYATSEDQNAKLSGITAASADAVSDTAPGEFHLLGGQMANFADKVRPNSFVQVQQIQKKLGSAEAGTNDVIGYEKVNDNNTGNYYITSFDIHDEAAKKDVVTKTDEGINYADNGVLYANDASDKENAFYFTNYADDSSNINPAMTVNFYNNIAVGSLRISKQVSATTPSTDRFYFKVEFCNVFGDESENWKEYDVTYRVYNLEDDTPVSSVTQPYGTVGVVIQPGQYAEIEGIPVETRFRVTEVERPGYSVLNIDKTAVKPDNSQITCKGNEVEGFYNYLNQGPVYQTMDDKVFVDSDRYTYYCNMIPTVSETYVASTGEYVSKSLVAYANKRENYTIQFKYYDRYMIDGTTAGINSTPTVYSKSLESIDPKYIVYNAEGDESSGTKSIKFNELIADNAANFANEVLNVSNVMCEYKIWTSQAAAVAGMANERYYVDGEKTEYPVDSRPFHTNYLGKPNTSGETWVTYTTTDKKVIAEKDLVRPSDYLSVRNIIVWCYNTPKQYNVDVYGAKSAGDLVKQTVDDKDVYVADATKTTSKSEANKFYYNQRFGTEVAGADDLNAAGFISNYGIPGVYSGNNGNLCPQDYAADTIGSYKFAYWAFDAKGTQLASTDIKYKYRVTKDTKLYAVYTTAEASGEIGLALSANDNDTYFDSDGVSRTRLNIMANVYNAEDNDPNIKKLAFVNITLSTQIRQHPETYTPAKINELFNANKDQLLSIIQFNENERKFSFSGREEGKETYKDGTIDLTLTTRGFIYTVTSNGNSPAPGEPEIKLTNKNRGQLSVSYKTSTLIQPAKPTCLVYCGAVKKPGVSGDEWQISDNCLIYRNGSVVDNTKTSWDD